MNNYSNPMVTYDEIVEALRAIIDCSKANGYLDDYGFLNVKYDSVKQNPIQKEQEQALLKANKKFTKRFRKMEELATKPLENYSYEEYDKLWKQAKILVDNETV